MGEAEEEGLDAGVVEGVGLGVGTEADGDGEGEGVGKAAFDAGLGEGELDAGAEIVNVTWGRAPPGDVTLNDLVVFLTV